MIFVCFLVTLLLTGAIATSIFKDLVNAVIALASVSLIAAILFYLLQAPDVAMAEAVIGTGLTTAIFLVTIRRTERNEK